MAKLMYAVFAERVSIDQFTNTVDILNVIENIAVPKPSPVPKEIEAQAKKKGKKAVPGATGRMKLFMHWIRSDPDMPEGSFKAKVSLLGPAGREISVSMLDLNFRQTPNFRTILGIDVLPIVGAGTYTAKISIRRGKVWRRAGEASFQLQYLPTSQVLSANRPQLH